MAKRADANQAEIISAFRACGAAVQTLHEVGRSCPDLLVGFRGRNLLVEVKDGSKPPSKRRLRPDQVRWHQTWRGQVAVVESVEYVLHVLGTVAA